MNIQNKLITLIIASMFISSCVIYTPQAVNPVLIEEKNELQCDMGVHFSPILSTPGINASIAYGLTNTLQLQAYGSILYKGFNHVRLMGGYRFHISQNKSLRLFAGYFYGNGTINQEPFNYDTEKVQGSNQAYFGKLQFTQQLLKNRKFGLTLTVGNYDPDFRINTYDSEIKFNQNALLNQASVFYHKPIGKNLRLNVSYTFVWFHPYNQSETIPYELSYNRLGTFGISFSYFFKSVNKLEE